MPIVKVDGAALARGAASLPPATAPPAPPGFLGDARETVGRAREFAELIREFRGLMREASPLLEALRPPPLQPAPGYTDHPAYSPPPRDTPPVGVPNVPQVAPSVAPAPPPPKAEIDAAAAEVRRKLEGDVAELIDRIPQEAYVGLLPAFAGWVSASDYPKLSEACDKHAAAIEALLADVPVEEMRALAKRVIPYARDMDLSIARRFITENFPPKDEKGESS